MKKRVLSLLLTLCLTLGLCGFALPNAQSAGVQPTAEGSFGENITWTFDEETGVLTVSGTGRLPSFYTDYVRPDWMDYAQQIAEVVIEEGITGIGHGNFGGLTALKSVTLPSSLEYIGTSAFHDDTSLEHLVIPEGVRTIDDWAFEDCSALSDITLPSTLTRIGYRSFMGCTALEYIVLPGNVSSLGNWAFNNSGLISINIPASMNHVNRKAFDDCNSLAFFDVDKANKNYYSDSRGIIYTKADGCPYRMPPAYEGGYTFPEGFDTIPSDVFNNCHKLTSFVIPEGVKEIGPSAFYGCRSLMQIEIPASVTTIGPGTAFMRCSSLRAITVHPDNPNYRSTNGALLSKDGKNLLTAPGGADVEFEIPSSVRTIMLYSFSGCDNISVLEIPEGVTTIDERSLAECVRLEKVVFPASLETIGWGQFLSPQDGYPNPPKVIEFLGDMPEGIRLAFSGTVVKVYYPANNDTWAGVEDLDLSCAEGSEWTTYTPHTYGPWEILEEATATQRGMKKRVCTDCGLEETREIGRLRGAFTDIKPADYFYAPVLWAASREITTGTAPTTFAPNSACTRAQVVTFLWRAMGEPAPSGRNPFTDVKRGEYYYDAVLWAVENGITTGTTATTFSPNAACTRAQIVTFLWRAAGSPEPKANNHGFTDLNATEYYSKAIAWAVENEITNGMTPTTFEPNRTCTRGQIATFLYRDMVL